MPHPFSERHRPAPETSQNRPGLLPKEQSGYTLCKVIALEKGQYSILQTNPCYHRLKGKKFNNSILVSKRVIPCLQNYN